MLPSSKPPICAPPRQWKKNPEEGYIGLGANDNHQGEVREQVYNQASWSIIQFQQ